MSDVFAPPVSNPVNVAELSRVCEPSTKSSAPSISNLAPAEGRVAIATLSVTFPVLNVKESAAAGIAVKIATPTVTMQVMIERLFMDLPPVPPHGMARSCINAKEIDLSYHYGGKPLSRLSMGAGLLGRLF